MFDRRATSCKAKAGREKLGNGSEGALEWIVLEHLKFHGDFDHTKVEVLAKSDIHKYRIYSCN